jgi:hypothetical protein
VPVTASRSFNAQARVGGAFAVVSAPLTIGAGPHVLIGKLYGSISTEGLLACELRASGITLDYSGAYLTVAASTETPMTLVTTFQPTTGPQSVDIVCQAPGATADLYAVQLVAIRVNALDAPN